MSRYYKRNFIRERKRKLILQKLIGLGFLAMSVILLIVALHGKTVEERDCTALLFLVPMALYLIFSGSVVID